MLRAMRAASTKIVPEPQNGSMKSDLKSQPDNFIKPAASTSLMGASTEAVR